MGTETGEGCWCVGALRRPRVELEVPELEVEWRRAVLVLSVCLCLLCVWCQVHKVHGSMCSVGCVGEVEWKSQRGPRVPKIRVKSPGACTHGGYLTSSGTSAPSHPRAPGPGRPTTTGGPGLGGTHGTSCRRGTRGTSRRRSRVRKRGGGACRGTLRLATAGVSVRPSLSSFETLPPPLEHVTRPSRAGRPFRHPTVRTPVWTSGATASATSTVVTTAPASAP